ncbi:RNA polymerase sigma factor [Pseudactinotalea suaedae]|uniref:RNA polymerase sigma factor n=1 Tax=Pseudactinotalea suaedae TaxID=1524924 RepID=UPI001F501534|nr:sigma-70 family RNA polymerase sigma factor [Pseudactinotalea suaedae]
MTQANLAETGRAAVEAIWRIESARLIAALARYTGDLSLAEELAQDALVTALEQWPTTGPPPNPGGWLMTTAKRRAIDRFRRDALHRRAVETLGGQTDEHTGTTEHDDVETRLDDPVGDDELALLFAACHPDLTREYRVTLTLRCLGGLSTDEIGRAFLIPSSAAGQRVSRAKKALRDRGIQLDAPTAAELPQRLDSVLEVIYLVFNEGYSATAGDDWMRPELSREALRLARRTAALLPDVAEVHGLLALLELTQARAAARTDESGAPVLLQDQDRRRWDRGHITRGLASLARVHRLGTVGRYGVQAAIAGAHSTAVSAAETDWVQIAALYDVLEQLWSNPVVTLNRAVAHGHAHGAEAGLAILATLPADRLADYPQRSAVEGELLLMAGRHRDAVAALERAARETGNGAERALLERRAAQASRLG